MTNEKEEIAESDLDDLSSDEEAAEFLHSSHLSTYKKNKRERLEEQLKDQDKKGDRKK